LLGALTHWCSGKVSNCVDVLLGANDIVEFFDFKHLLDDGRSIEVVLC